MSAPVLLVIAIVLAAARAGGWLARRLRQPPVIGEMLSVMACGPVLLGRLSSNVAPMLAAVDVLAQLGVPLFMFLVGLELRLDRRDHRGLIGVTLGSLVLPLALGALASLAVLSERGSGATWAFVLFVSTSLAVTAVPVLALILRDRGLIRSPIARMALTAATASDVLAWSLLAVVAAETHGSELATGPRLAAALGLVACLSALGRAVRNQTQVSRLARSPTILIGVTLIGVMLSAVASDAAGLRTVIGPLLLGVMMAHNLELRETLERVLQPTVRSLLLPFFFLSVGVHLELSSLASPGITLLLLAAAVVGKVGGTLLGARLASVAWPDAWQMGVMLNTRGLTELVFLTAGLQLGVINSELYTALVTVALITTVATGPLLNLCVVAAAHSRARVR